MYAVFHMPMLRLQATCGGWRGLQGRAVALVDGDLDVSTRKKKAQRKAVVIEVSSKAIKAGVQPGQTAAQAMARCAGLQVKERDEAAEKYWQQMLLACADRFSPDYENTAPGVVTLDWFGVCRTVAEASPYAERAVREMRRQNGTLHVGIAPSPDLAALAARDARPVRLLSDEPRHLELFLHPLPIEALDLRAELCQVLASWGVSTVGEFLALPAAETAERLGPETMEARRRLDPRHRRLLHLERLPDRYRSAMELEYAVEQLEPLLFLLHGMLVDLCNRLRAAYRVAAALFLRLGLDGGAVYQRRLRVAEPCSDVDILLGILHSHLEKLQSDQPIVSLALELTPSIPSQAQEDLFSNALKDPRRFADTLSRLEAMLGAERVGTPRPLNTHRPDAFDLPPFCAELTTGQNVSENHDDASFWKIGLGFRRFRPAQRVTVVCDGNHRGAPPLSFSGTEFAQTTVQKSVGPWLCSGEWWDVNRWQREEWDVCCSNGMLCRLIRDRGGWFIDGVYG